MNPPPCINISEELQNNATCHPKHITPVFNLLDYITRNCLTLPDCIITWFRVTVKSLWTVLPASLGCLILEMEKFSIFEGSGRERVKNRQLWETDLDGVQQDSLKGCFCSCEGFLFLLELRCATQRLHCPNAIKKPRRLHTRVRTLISHKPWFEGCEEDCRCSRVYWKAFRSEVNRTDGSLYMC